MTDQALLVIGLVCGAITLFAAWDFYRIQRQALRSIQELPPRGAAESWEEFYRQVAAGMAGNDPE